MYSNYWSCVTYSTKSKDTGKRHVWDDVATEFWKNMHKHTNIIRQRCLRVTSLLKWHVNSIWCSLPALWERWEWLVSPPVTPAGPWTGAVFHPITEKTPLILTHPCRLFLLAQGFSFEVFYLSLSTTTHPFDVRINCKDRFRGQQTCTSSV